MTRPPLTSGDSDRGRAVALRVVAQFQRAVQRRDRSEIVANLQELIALRAPMAGQWLQLALIGVDLGEIGLARAAAGLYVEAFERSPQAHFDTVAIFARFGAYDEALAILRSLPPTVPDNFSYSLSRGAAALNAGEIDEARHWLSEALRLRPHSGSAWHQLSLFVDFAAEPNLADRLLAVESEMQHAPSQERALYYYALGKVHADRADRRRAFAAVTRAASETKALYPNDRSIEQRLATEATEGYDAARIAALEQRQTEPTGRSIFVMGLPRSGTTLVEQVLTSHSEVSGGGEIDLLRLLVHETGNASYAALERFVDTAGVPPLAKFWDHLLDQRFPGSRRVVDKTTDTSRKLGLAAAVLPDAPLIWLTRDPLDCAWSCYRTCFMQGIRWSNDLSDLAFAFRLEDYLLSQWREILGERLLVVPYDELVTKPDSWIRRILGHCGLGAEPATFAPHENRRVVNTASVMQVRKPINRKAIGSAEPYREFLQPFVKAYYG